MKEPILKNYYTIYTDCWMFFKKYSDPKDSDEYWRAVACEANDLYKKHGEVAFSEKVIGDTLDELERLWKEKDAKERG